MKKTNPMRGNALFMILIAIFLLGLITAVLVRQSTTTEETGDTERGSLKASEIVNYLSNIQAGVQNLLANGCSESQLNFYTDAYPGADTLNDPGNFDGPADGSCDVFGIRGAGIKAKKFDPEKYGGGSNAPGFAADGSLPLEVYIIPVPNLGSGKAEIAVVLDYVDMGICNNINKRNGIGLYSGSDPNYVLDPANGFAPPPLGTASAVGYYRWGNIVEEDMWGGPIVPLINDLAGKKIFCVANTDNSNAAADWSSVWAIVAIR